MLNHIRYRNGILQGLKFSCNFVENHKFFDVKKAYWFKSVIVLFK